MSPATARPLLKVEKLSIRHRDGREIVRNANFEIVPGEIVLLIGPSGSGKSTLLSLFSGLLDRHKGWRAEGCCRLPNQTVDLSQERAAAGGIVFQNYALFDELSVRGNLAAAAEHGEGGSEELSELISSLLSDIGQDQKPAELSGGQQQRVAIARSLLARRPLLFFDEPNAGLDPVQTRRLVELIDRLRREQALSVVIVAHHVHDLLPVADRVLLLDPQTRSLQQLDPASPRLADYCPVVPKAIKERQERHPVHEPAGEPAAYSSAIRLRLRPSWWFSYAAQYFWLLALAPSMLAFIVIGGLLTGFVATWSAFQYMPFANYLLPLVHDDTLTALGLTQSRVLAPLMLSVLMAARNAAIVAADVGHRVYTRQIEAMISLNMSHRGYISGGVLASSLLGALLLALLLLAVAATASLVTWQAQFPELPAAIFRDAFFQLVFREGDWLPDGWLWMLAKILPSALAAGALGLHFGQRPKTSVVSLNSAIAQAIIFGVSAALIINALVTLIEPIRV